MQYSSHFLPSMYFRNDNLEDRCLLPWLLPADTLEGSKLIIQGICLAKFASSMCSVFLSFTFELGSSYSLLMQWVGIY